MPNNAVQHKIIIVYNRLQDHTRRSLLTISPARIGTTLTKIMVHVSGYLLAESHVLLRARLGWARRWGADHPLRIMDGVETHAAE